MYKQGIDISSFQEHIDWKKIHTPFKLGKDTYVTEFCYIRASGGNIFDMSRTRHAKNAKDYGVKISYYHYAIPKGRDAQGNNIILQDAQAKADLFNKSVQTGYPYDFPCALDIEENKSLLTPQEYLLWVNTFIERWKSHGHKDIVIYSGPYFLNQTLPKNHNLGQYKLWLSHYGVFEHSVIVPNGWKNWWMWQFSGSFKAHPAIHDHVDMNFCVGL